MLGFDPSAIAGRRRRHEALQKSVGWCAQGRKANGAGIAADPTLTSAWSFVSFAPEGASVSKALGARCLSACPKARVLSPALAPASDPACGVLHSLWAETLRSCGAPWGRAETDDLLVSAISNSCFRFDPSASSIADQIFGLSDGVVSLCPQTIRFAFGRSLLHIVSNTARGQSPTHLRPSEVFEIQHLAGCFSKPSRFEDKLKLSPNLQLRKSCKAELSTFAQITCGRQWKSHQFVAFADFGFQKRRPSACFQRNIGLIGTRSDARLALKRSRIPFGEQFEPQGVQFDKAFCIMLIVCACIIFKSDMRL
ncbi:hypothetical protein [Erythrobacter sp. MTPC3]|uniref:hypothetical protein n=1 Tax=Erythrobacter sp. MTPC3 TaxID=3056564 RepID=UPI0036F1FA9F